MPQRTKPDNQGVFKRNNRESGVMRFVTTNESPARKTGAELLLQLLNESEEASSKMNFGPFVFHDSTRFEPT
jgi:hypothetical protein